tara:strand:+ start:587 stop:1177 length:591 start_codon:yes stop_codon:yes gene_type:complete
MLLEEAEIKLNLIDKNNAPIPARNKGGRGQWVEKQLGMNLSSKLNDFDNGELKAFKETEPIAVTMLLHCFDEVFDRSISFSESKVGKKLKNVLFVQFAKKTGKFVGSVVTNAESHRELYYKLSEDYNDVCEGIRRCYENKEDVHTINGRNGYLQIRSKANKTSKGVYNPLVYNGQQVYHCAMAFYLRNQFARVIFS